MAKLNKLKLSRNALFLKEVSEAAEKNAEERLDFEKNVFLKDFSSHPVTLEIEAGETAKNFSGTLGGYGNLFSFIGFRNGDSPVSSVKQLINRIRIYKKSFVKKNGVLSFRVFLPTLAEFEAKTPMPWEPSRSWLSGIERGISGFGFFISRILSGRSMGGIQSESKLRSGSFRNVSYFTKMYNSFLRRLGSNFRLDK